MTEIRSNIAERVIGGVTAAGLMGGAAIGPSFDVPQSYSPENSHAAPFENPNTDLSNRLEIPGFIVRMPETEGETLPFTEIISGIHGNDYKESTIKLISSSEEWESEWNIINNSDPEWQAPAIDFTRQKVLILAQGEGTSEGRMLQVAEIKDTGEKIKVSAKKYEPDEMCKAPQLMKPSRPMQVIAFDAIDKPVEVDVDVVTDVLYKIGEASSVRKSDDGSTIEYGKSAGILQPALTEDCNDPNPLSTFIDLPDNKTEFSSIEPIHIRAIAVDKDDEARLRITVDGSEIPADALNSEICISSEKMDENTQQVEYEGVECDVEIKPGVLGEGVHEIEAVATTQTTAGKLKQSIRTALTYITTRK